MNLKIDGQNLDQQQVVNFALHQTAKVELAEGVREQMQKSRTYIEKRLEQGEVMYGVNTGFGAFSSVRISDQEIEALQRNLIRSHSCGIGDPLSVQQTRAIMLLRANTLVRGHSGVRPVVVDKILEFLNNQIIPVIPSQGSVGASGDLAPLSHLALALMGEGFCWSQTEPRQQISVQSLLQQKNVQPLTLKAKEGLSLINGCQVMTAIGLIAAAQARDLLLLADLAGSMSLEGLRGSRSAFDLLISATRPHEAERKTAWNIMQILSPETEISRSHQNCDRVQDAYSLRCMPAVHGAAKSALRYAWNVLKIETNSSTDNPLVFADENKILSCGNFHGEPVSMALDFAGMAISVLGNISECRIAKLINPTFSQLPAFLAPQGGLNSGYMIIQVAAASLVSENKILAHPACVDSIPTSTDKEDHVSMGTIAARKFQKITDNVTQIIAMELMAGAQAVEMLRPLKSSETLEAVHQKIREYVPYAAQDRVFAEDIQNTVQKLIQTGELLRLTQKHAGELLW